VKGEGYEQGRSRRHDPGSIINKIILMTTEQFTYWLQGFAEIQSSAPTEEQWTMIKDHLAIVFDKKTPDRTKLA
jgi:hypothetical protein